VNQLKTEYNVTTTVCLSCKVLGNCLDSMKIG